MTRLDYSSNAELINEEVYDFDSADAHETGINTYRMRLPERYDIAKFYKRDSKPSSYDKFGNPRYEKGEWTQKPTKLLPDISEDFDWQITYKFPSTIHNNISPLGKVYGGANVTYRRLYLILCERFNNGEFFVDEYFNTTYQDSWVKEEVDVELNNLKDELLFYAEDITEGAILTKSGKIDKRFKANRGMTEKLKEWEEYKQEWEEKKGNYLAEIIREDIIKALENGEIPLKHVMSSETERERIRVGYDRAPLFYAMGDLIKHIQLFVKIGGNGKWRTQSGLVV